MGERGNGTQEDGPKKADDLPETWMMAALTCLLAGCTNEHIEVNAGMIDGYDRLRSHTMKYVAQRIFEKTRRPMQEAARWTWGTCRMGRSRHGNGETSHGDDRKAQEDRGPGRKDQEKEDWTG